MARIECVPNISEGRQTHVVDACAAAITAGGAVLLDVHSDRDHHRSVFTFAGAPADVSASAHRLVDTAVRLIAIDSHLGVHPRVGVVDVVPFVPLAGATLEECVTVAREFAAGIARRHELPVYLYEAAAVLQHRRRLESIRRGGLPDLAARMTSGEWRPDYGPCRPHPTAGVTVVGARQPLIAYNINLASDRLDIARAIAATVRASSGGLPCVKALGLALADRGLVQVSMNLTDFRVTSMREVFQAVRREAVRHGVDILESEIVGLVPEAALSDVDAYEMNVRGFDGTQILERRL